MLTSVAFAVNALAAQVPLQVHDLHDGIFSPTFLAFVEELRKNQSIPGISVGAVRLAGDGKGPHVHLSWFGRKTEDGDGNDLTPDTLFAIASCSKAYLATCVGLLIDDFAHGRNVTPIPDGVTRLDWDTKISALLPQEWLMDDPWTTRAANIRDVLGHVTGLPRHDFTYKVDDTAGDVVRRMRHLRTAYELREKWSYNNQMYVLGSYIVAKYANSTYPEFVTDRLLAPVNMSTTTLWPSEAAASGKLSHGWSSTGRRIPFWASDHVNAFNAGAGGVLSSAEDTVKWLAIWLNKGVHPVSGDVIIPKHTYEEVTTAHNVVSGRPTPDFRVGVTGYGAGWQRGTYGEIEAVWHTGGLPGFSSITAFSPSSNLGIIVLINADGQNAIYTIAKRAFDDVLGRPAHSTRSSVEASAEAQAPSEETASEDPEPPSLDIDAYAGTYTAPGYGTITLCSSKSTSHHCSRVISELSSVEPIDGARLGLGGAYERVLSTHVRLRHRSGDAFELAFVSLFPNGYGKNTTAFEVYEAGFSEGRAEFVVEGNKVAGFAFVIDQDAVEARKRRVPGGAMKDAADAWFTKL
ncbi:beta-lactamase/transpeptidase-like protein [Trametes polyzona]|nr:beta-lactamase/transpeptidase-like protein [Trametes polyzona]